MRAAMTISPRPASPRAGSPAARRRDQRHDDRPRRRPPGSARTPRSRRRSPAGSRSPGRRRRARDDIARADADQVAVEVHLVTALIGAARVVAAVWLTMTRATTAAIGATWLNADQDSPCSPRCGAPWATEPSTKTPWTRRPSTRDEDREGDQTRQRARQPAINPLCDEHDGEHADPNAQRPPVGCPQLPDQGSDAVQGVATGTGHAEQVRELVYHRDDPRPPRETR